MRIERPIARLAIAVALAGFAWNGTAAETGPTGASTDRGKGMTVPAVVAAVRPSVVTILTRGVPPAGAQHGTPAGSGSGFIVDEKGFILTNNHLVEGVKSLVVGLSTGRLTPGRVVARDYLLDLAIVKIDAKDLVAAPLGEAASLQIGEAVVAIGNPFALKGGSTVTVGVVSAVDRSILAPNGETLYDLIQTDAAINPGNSGGPLVDLSGRVVGINAAVAPAAQAISYAIAIDGVYEQVQSMLVRGSVWRPDLGVVPLTITSGVVAAFNLELDRGVLAVQVEPTKLMGQFGVQTGDIITSVDGLQVYNAGDFWHGILRSTAATVQVGLWGKNGPFSIAFPKPPLLQSSR
jgi:S1-C subfamily serine protease